jgi:hypothetical protein
MSSDLSTEITAIATAVLAAFAILSAYYARRAFLKQSQEVSAIERQVRDQEELTQQQAELLKMQSAQLELQRKQLDNQRRGQAIQIFFLVETYPPRPTYLGAFTELTLSEPRVGIVPAKVTAQIQNNSGLPVYDLIIRWRKEAAAVGEPDDVGLLPPGHQIERERFFEDWPGEHGHTVFDAVLYFRDAAGVRWCLRPGGHLDEELANGETL